MTKFKDRGKTTSELVGDASKTKTSREEELAGELSNIELDHGKESETDETC
jgi:hypothetical protein